MERSIKISVGEYYHIYNRGVEKRAIFIDDNDRERFIRLLHIANGQRPVVFRLVQGLPLAKIEMGEKNTAILSYALMPNHFHILTKEVHENGVSEFMEKILTGYSMYFNKKYKRVGPLFQGTFKAEHVERDEYLKYLFAYIHLNPIKLIEPKWKEQGIQDSKKAEQFLRSYQFSSYLDYVGVERDERIILSQNEAPQYFMDKFEFKDFVADWLRFKKIQG